MTRFPLPRPRLAVLTAGLAFALAGQALAQTEPGSALGRAPDPARCKVGVHASIADCDAALVQVADPKARAQALFVRGYLKNDQQLYESALPDLDEAIRTAT